MPWHGCSSSVKRWEVRGLVGGVGDLQDIHPDPSQPVDDLVTEAMHGWSEELGLKYFSSEKRCCVLLSASWQGGGNRCSAAVSGACPVHQDEDGK